MTQTRDELQSIGRAARILFVAFAVVRVLDAAGVPVDPMGTLLLLLAALMILAHVAATIIGTSRRDGSDFDAPALGAESADSRVAAGALVREQSRVMVLHADLPLSRRALAWSIAGAVSAAAGMAAISFRAWPRVGIGGAMIVESSAALIGAYFGFMAARLTAAAKSAFRQAAGRTR